MGKIIINKEATKSIVKDTDAANEIAMIENEEIDDFSEIDEFEVSEELIIIDKKNSGIKRGADVFTGISLSKGKSVKIKTEVGGIFYNDDFDVTYHADDDVYIITDCWFDVIYKLTDKDNHKLAVYQNQLTIE